MGVAADEKFWRTGEQTGADAGVVAAGIAADMFHQHLHFLTFEAVFLAEAHADVMTVDVAIDTA